VTSHFRKITNTRVLEVHDHSSLLVPGRKELSLAYFRIPRIPVLLKVLLVIVIDLQYKTFPWRTVCSSIIMSLYYNSEGQLVQSVPPYPQPLPQPQVMDTTSYPNQQSRVNLDPGQMQTGYDNYSPAQSGPRRSPRLGNRAEATPPYRKRKSTTRKVVEGVLIGAAGTAVLSEIENHRRKSTRSSTKAATSTSGGGGNMDMNELIEGGLAAGAIALALYEKNRKAKETGLPSEHKSVGDPRMKTLVEGALATAAAVALAFHENSNKAKGIEKEVESV
jgi:hypothetical protein